MTDAQGNQLTYRQVAERMTLKTWTGGEAAPASVPTTGSDGSGNQQSQDG
jgi:hypothetical protein